MLIIIRIEDHGYGDCSASVEGIYTTPELANQALLLYQTHPNNTHYYCIQDIPVDVLPVIAVIAMNDRLLFW